MLDKIVNTLNGIVWNPALVVLLIGAGLYFSFRTRFVQVRRFSTMLKLLFKGNADRRNGISSFEAFCLALSGRVGTGNIVGVATAIAFGGPGAVFWMWVVAFSVHRRLLSNRRWHSYTGFRTGAVTGEVPSLS